MEMQGLCVATLFCFFNGEVIAQVKRKYRTFFFSSRARSNSYTATQVSVSIDFLGMQRTRMKEILILRYICIALMMSLLVPNSCVRSLNVAYGTLVRWPILFNSFLYQVFLLFCLHSAG